MSAWESIGKTEKAIGKHKKQVETLNYLEFFNKELMSLKDFISNNFNPEIINELENIKKQNNWSIEKK